MKTADEGNSYQLQHILGAGAIRVCALNDERIVYSAAQQVVIQNTTTKSQRFIESGEITAMVVDRSRDVVGFSEKGTGAVKFYDAATLLRKRELIREAGRGGGERGAVGAERDDVLFISISSDFSRCVVLGEAPSYELTMWDVDRSVAFASVVLSTVTKKRIVSAEVCPANKNLVSVIGRKTMRLFHVSNTNGKFVPVKTGLRTDQNYAAQIWLPSSGELVLATEARGLVVMGDDKEAKQVLKVEHASTTLAACPGGFATGCCQGSVSIFQRSHRKDSYSLTKTIHLENKTGIVSLAVMKMEDGSRCDAVCLTKTRSIIKVYFNEDCDDDAHRETEIVPSLNQSLRSIDYLIPDSGSLFVDCCAWMPLVVVGGYDGVVRLFDHCTKRVVLTQRLDDRICDISFHPHGKYLLVTSTKSVRLFAILTDKLNVIWQVEDLQQIALARFSQGGDRFAIALGTVVQVHDLYLDKSVSTLRGHSKPVFDVSFRGHKNELITIGVDGVVCLWDISRGVVKTRTVDEASPAYIAGCVSEDYAHVISADSFLKRINIRTGEIENLFKYDANSVSAMLALSSGKNIVCLNDGNVECISSILDGSSTKQQCFRHNRITSIQCAKYLSSLLVTADGEGFLTFYQCGENTPQSPDYLPYEGISNVSKAEFEKQSTNTKSLKNSIQALQSEHALTLDSLHASHEVLKRKVEGELNLKMNRCQLEVDELTNDIQSLELKHKSDTEMIGNQHEGNLQSINEDCKKRLATEKQKTEQFTKSCQDKKREFEAQMTELATAYAVTINKETRSLHELMARGNRKNDSLCNDISMSRLRTLEEERMMEADADREITELSATHQKELKSLKRSNTLLSNEKDILQQRQATSLQDLKELQDQIDSQEDKLRSSEESTKTLDSAIEANRAAIVEQDKAILQKERDICFYSQANLEEEHHNSDLVDTRLTLEEILSTEKKKAKQKEIDLEKKKAEMKDIIVNGRITRIEMNRLAMKLQQINTNINKMQKTREEKEQLLEDFEHGIANVMSQIDDHKSLKVSLCSLSEQFFQDTSNKKLVSGSSNTEKKLALDRKICTIRNALARKKKTHANEMERLLREHSVLEKEQEITEKKVNEKIVTAKHKRCCGGPLSDSKLFNK